jgi:hypothetical protein
MEVRTNLVFHGGSGETLQMRVFSREAGFATARVMEEDYPPAGIPHRDPWSLPILARKPG